MGVQDVVSKTLVHWNIHFNKRICYSDFVLEDQTWALLIEEILNYILFDLLANTSRNLSQSNSPVYISHLFLIARITLVQSSSKITPSPST
jgi:hypothetical protein